MISLIRDILRKMRHKIRLWNPKHFPNPFYSPSLVGIEAGKEFIRLFEIGWEEGVKKSEEKKADDIS